MQFEQPPSIITLGCGHDVALAGCFNVFGVDSHISEEVTCNTMVVKTLPCGHSAAVACSVHVAAVRCSVMVIKTLPCGHTASVACSNNQMADVTCTAAVVKQLPCDGDGHTATLACSTDPAGVACMVVVLKTLPCGHAAALACSTDTATVKCTAAVIKALPCGHVAALACSTPPAEVRCSVLVVKEWPFCGHHLETKCSTDVRGRLCTAPCTLPLPDCEHPCNGTCGECRNGRLHMRCERRCDRLLVCGHPCESKMCSKVCPPCEQPCETVCGHGPCGYVQRREGERSNEGEKSLPSDQKEEESRMEEEAGNAEDGGNTDSSSTHSSQRSGSRSSRSASPSSHPGSVRNTEQAIPSWFYTPRVRDTLHKCGQTCPTCEDVCLNRCEHRACSKTCWESCDVEPCKEPCLKPLACSQSHPSLLGESHVVEHLCIGMCGEPCPQLCAICNPVEYAELKNVFLGYEDEKDARFVQLADCRHIIEARGLDMHIQAQMSANQMPMEMVAIPGPEEPGTSAAAAASANAENQSSHAIVTLSCPKCKTPIRQSQRYISALNERAADLEAIKRKMYGSSASEQSLANQWRILKRRFADLTEGLLNVEVLSPFLCHLVDLMSVFNPGEEQKHHFNLLWLNTAENVVNIAGELIKRNRALTRGGLYHDIRGVSGALSHAQQPNLRRVLQEWLPTMLASTTTTSFDGGYASMMYYLDTQLLDSEAWDPLFGDYLQGELVQLLGRLAGGNCALDSTLLPSDAELHQLTNELSRYDLVVELTRYLCRLIALRKEDIDEEGKTLLVSILKAINGPEQFCGKHADAVAQNFESLATHHKVNYELSKEERVAIAAAMAGHVTTWYKCSKGHLYGVGDCGNPEQRTQCPECDENIGGSRRIVHTSTEATEMMGQLKKAVGEQPMEED